MIVVNSSPLIALSRIGHLQLLPDIYSEVYIPLAVQKEIVSVGIRVGTEAVKNASWIHVVTVSNPNAVHLFRKKLDAGESEAIVLAVELNAELLLMDELKGRRIAEAMGLNISGTLGTLVLAKKRGFLTELKPLLAALMTSEFRMAKPLYHKVLSLVGEIG
jgi:hypothetical protein